MARSVSQVCLMTGILLVLATFPFALGKFQIFEKTLPKGSTNITSLKRWTTRSKLHCAIACAGQSECKSFSVLPNLHECNLYASKITAADILAALSSEEKTFYWKQNAPLPRVCPLEKGYAIVPGTHKCLRIDREIKIWTDAQQTCEAEGGHLAIIEDLATWGAVRAFLIASGPILNTDIYLGGQRTSTGQWEWLDGSAVEVGLWSPGEPNVDYSEDPCVTVWWGRRLEYFLLLDEYPCPYPLPFVCEV